MGRSKPTTCVIDLIEHANVIWRPYESRRDLTPFREICWYSRWIMAGWDMMCRHLSEWVMRQYGYVQTIPRPPTTIGDLAPTDVVMTFTDLSRVELYFFLSQLRAENKNSSIRSIFLTYNLTRISYRLI